MKYGKILIVLGVVNIFTMFSGMPTSWKKALILITSCVIMSIGWIIKTIAQKRKERAHTQAQTIIREHRQEFEQLSEQVEQELDRI